ncbi:MAG: bifunctional metallophosphatase/5'-nucleotidase [Candidatus Aegiribacteria sp.]|nr:bifunctional metallophosphatase/5'-nucleotidase [Candidatus Aegiribacteria sp.]
MRILLPVLLLALIAAAGADTIYLNILHTNDIHGGIVPREATFMNPDFPPMIGGGAYISSYVDGVREECSENGEYCLLIDAGDIYQGTPTGNYESGELIMDWMNAAGYDLMTLGNHDFDDGTPNTLELCEQADFPVICTNFVDSSTGEIPYPVIPYEMFEFDGVSIAFIGLTTTDTYGLVSPELLENHIFLNEVECTERYIEEVEEQGADIIILVSHLGQPGDPDKYLERVYEAWSADEEYTKDFCMNHAELTCLVPGIDLIVSGHTHLGFAEPWVNPVNHTLVVQGYANGTGIGRIRLEIDTDTKTLIGYDLPEGEEYISLLHDEFWPDPAIAQMIEGFRSVAEAGMDEVLAEAVEQIPRGNAEHPMGRLIADAMLWSTDTDVALMNRGGIRAAIPRGPITSRVVYQAIPFEEDLFILEVTGAELKAILETGMQGRRRDMEIGGLTADRNQAMPDGEKIENMIVCGEPLNLERTYRLVTSGYLAQGNVGYDIMLEHEVLPANITLMEAVTGYIAELGEIEADNQIRITWIEEPR